MAHSLASLNHSRFHLLSSSNSRAIGTTSRPRQFLEIQPLPRRNRMPTAGAMQSSSSVDSTAVSSNNGETLGNSGKKNNLGPILSAAASIPLPNIPIWARLVVGSILCLALPFYKRMLRIEGGVEREIKTVVEIVEKVAEVTETIASDVADSLPGNGRLKQAALSLELIAEKVDKGAEKAESIIDKIHETKEAFDEMAETYIGEEDPTEKQGHAKETSPVADSSKPT